MASQTSGPLAAGTVVQYRTVGRAVIEQHNCPDERSCVRGFIEPVHQYAVRFETGRYRGQVRNVWVRNSEELLTVVIDGGGKT